MPDLMSVKDNACIRRLIRLYLHKVELSSHMEQNADDTHLHQSVKNPVK